MTQSTHSTQSVSSPTPFTIISGGQIGADRAGLDVALARGIPHAGWCPKGRKSEDGPLPACYQLTETPTASYLVRTERNVTDSDATVIFTLGALGGGSIRTAEFAKIHGRPLLHLMVPAVPDALAVGRIVAFVRAYRVTRLNVAGSRESKAPGIHAHVCRVLNLALDQLGLPGPGIDPPTVDSPQALTVDVFCELHVRRHDSLSNVVNDPELSETARNFLLACVPIPKADGSGIADVLPSGPKLLTFLCQNHYTVQLSWLPNRINIHLSSNDFEIQRTSGVHEFHSADGASIDPLDDAFDEVIVKMILHLKYRQFELDL